jgi:hypothetical protein
MVGIAEGILCLSVGLEESDDRTQAIGSAN